MKKIYLLCVCMLTCMLIGCGKQPEESKNCWNRVEADELADSESEDMSGDVSDVGSSDSDGFQDTIRVLKDVVLSEDFRLASPDVQQTMMSEQLGLLAEKGEIMDDYSYNSDVNGYDFVTSNGLFYTISADGVNVQK